MKKKPSFLHKLVSTHCKEIFTVPVKWKNSIYIYTNINNCIYDGIPSTKHPFHRYEQKYQNLIPYPVLIQEPNEIPAQQPH